ATMGDPVKNKSLWEGRSPINFVDRVKAPVLLLAGGNDPRCPKSEAQQVADVIKKCGGTVEFKICENEGHGFARLENQIDAYNRVAEFLKKYLPAPPSGCNLYGNPKLQTEHGGYIGGHQTRNTARRDLAE